MEQLEYRTPGTRDAEAERQSRRVAGWLILHVALGMVALIWVVVAMGAAGSKG